MGQKLKKIWLICFVTLVVLMISVGGITRLTRSGLSITEWRPVTGIIPPLSTADWQSQFELYQNSPEFRQVNSTLSLESYKTIFMWEYVHRLLGRLIFLVALLPGIYFWRRKLASGAFVTSLTLLVMIQGLIGWIMVKSGLQNEPAVSPWLLSLHFFSAVTVLLVAYYQSVKMRSSRFAISANLRLTFFWLLPFLLLQILYGNLAAGLKAGFAYNTFPLMSGSFFPEAATALNPGWSNLFANPAMVQFIHRWLGIFVFILILNLVRLFRPTKAKGPIFHLFGVAFLQVCLGVLNILYVVPIGLAVAHQLMATLLVMAYFSLLWRLQLENHSPD